MGKDKDKDKKQGKSGKPGKSVKAKNGTVMVAGGRITLDDGTVVDNRADSGYVYLADGDLDVKK